MSKLSLADLKAGLPGISKNIGAFLAEAALICLDLNGHPSGIKIGVSGLVESGFTLEWSDKVDAELAQSWKDLKEATEYGATAIAALIVPITTGMLITGRVPQLEQADYILQKPTNYNRGLIEPDALLEVSGILKEKEGNTLNMRIQKKKRHIESTVKRTYPTYVIVVEFGIPKSKIIEV